MLRVKLHYASWARAFSFFPTRAISTNRHAVTPRRVRDGAWSGESVWRRGLFSCTLTAAAVERYRRACPRFHGSAALPASSIAHIATHCPSVATSPSRVTLHYVLPRVSPGKSVHRYLHLAPPSPDPYLSHIIVRGSLLCCFCRLLSPSPRLYPVCLCDFVDRLIISVLCSHRHRHHHHRRQHHAAPTLQRDMFTMDGWCRRAQRMSRRKQSNPKPLKREFVLSFSRLYLACLFFRWHVSLWCVYVFVCVCVCACYAGGEGYRVRFGSRAFQASFFFPRRDS